MDLELIDRPWRSVLSHISDARTQSEEMLTLPPRHSPSVDRCRFSEPHHAYQGDRARWRGLRACLSSAKGLTEELTVSVDFLD